MADTDPTGKTILNLDPLVGEVDKPNSFVEVHVVGQAESQKLSLDNFGTGPADLAKQMQAIALALPGLFTEPWLEEYMVNTEVQGTVCFLDFWLYSPWSEVTIDWGNGSTLTFGMNFPNMALNSLGELAFPSLRQQVDYMVPGTYSVTVSAKTAYGDVSYSRDIIIPAA